MTDAPGNLADQRFWVEHYLRGVELPARPDPAMPFERSLAEALALRAPAAARAEVLEVGCAPAKWLLFYAERFGARPNGIEYTEHGADLSRRNLAAAGVEGHIVQGDFFAVEPVAADLVLSLGFIEHFDDLDEAFRRHLDYLRPGGTLVIGVPNYRGGLGRLQRLTDPAHLDLHNLEAMRPALYRRLAREHGLAITWQGYLNGPDPALLRMGRRWVLPAVVVLDQLHRRGPSRGWNRPWLSSYLLTVFART